MPTCSKTPTRDASRASRGAEKPPVPSLFPTIVTNCYKAPLKPSLKMQKFLKSQPAMQACSGGCCEFLGNPWFLGFPRWCKTSLKSNPRVEAFGGFWREAMQKSSKSWPGVQTFFPNLLKPLLLLGFGVGGFEPQHPQKSMRRVVLLICFFSMNNSRKSVKTCPL